MKTFSRYGLAIHWMIIITLLLSAFAPYPYAYQQINSNLIPASRLAPDKQPEILVNKTDLTLYEAYTSTVETYGISLSVAPTQVVTVSLSLDNPQYIIIDRTYVTFTASNFNTPQNINVRVRDDYIAQGTHYTNISHTAVSHDSRYNGMAGPVVKVTINDNDVAGISVIPVQTAAITEGLSTKYRLTLTSRPLASVQVNISTDANLSSVNPNGVLFVPDDWRRVYTVTVGTTDDNIQQGSRNGIVYHSAASTDPKYTITPANGPTVTVPILDNDKAGLNITRYIGSPSIEGGHYYLYISLATQPQHNVTVSFTPDSYITIPTPPLQFTQYSWNNGQWVDIVINDDQVYRNIYTSTINYSVSAPGDQYYDNMYVPSEKVRIRDNDSAGLYVYGPFGASIEGSSTNYPMYIRLTSEPLQTVYVNINPNPEVTFNTTSYVFNSSNWFTYQAIIYQTPRDYIAVAGSYHQVPITFTMNSNDAYYNKDVGTSITLMEMDVAGMNMKPNNLYLREGMSTTVQMKIQSKPLTPIYVKFNDTSGRFSFSNKNLTFTTDNWLVTQTITIYAIDDLIAMDNVLVDVPVEVSSQDPLYNNYGISSLKITIEDNDIAGILITKKDVLTTTETGGTAVFSVTLKTQPRKTVTLVLTSTNPAEGMVLDPMTWVLTFYTYTWNIPQKVVVIGRPDHVYDNNKSYSILLKPYSPDSFYNHTNMANPVVDLVNINKDGPGISIGNATVTEGDFGSTWLNLKISLSYAIPLTNPTNVQVSYRTMDGSALAGSDYKTTYGTVTFPAGVDWSQITIPIINDLVPERTEEFYVVLYNPTNNATLAQMKSVVTIIDNDPNRIYLPVSFNNFSSLVYMDDFSTDTGWPQNKIPEPGSTVQVSGGKLFIMHNSANRNVRVVAPLPASSIPGSFAVETIAYLASDSVYNARYGLLFNWIDSEHFYRFLVEPDDQSFYIYRYQNGWVSLISGTASAIYTNAPNRLRIERTASVITAYVNGQLVAKITGETTYQGGQVGVTILTPADLAAGAIADVAFDIFEVYKFR